MTITLSNRLEIRRFLPADCDDIYEYLSKEAVVKYESYQPFTFEESKHFLGKMVVSPDFWAVCLKETSKVIGQVYLAEKEQCNWELGYVFNDAFQKMGYATEAANTLIESIIKNHGAHRISAKCNPDNQASWKLLERLGFKREGHLRSNVYFNKDEKGNPIWQDTFIYALLV